MDNRKTPGPDRPAIWSELRKLLNLDLDRAGGPQSLLLVQSQASAPTWAGAWEMTRPVLVQALPGRTAWASIMIYLDGDLDDLTDSADIGEIADAVWAWTRRQKKLPKFSEALPVVVGVGAPHYSAVIALQADWYRWGLLLIEEPPLG